MTDRAAWRAPERTGGGNGQKKRKELKKAKKPTKKVKRVAKKEKAMPNTEANDVDRVDVRPVSPFSS